VKAIKKQTFLKIISVIFLSGTILLAVFYYLAIKDYYLKHQPTSIYKKPSFLYSIESNKSFAINNPTGVKIAYGQLLFTSLNGEIVKTTREGRFLGKIKLTKNKNLNLLPRDLTVDSFGRIYVSVGPINKVLVYDWSGKFRYAFPQIISPNPIRQSKNTKLISPVGLLFQDGKIYVTDVGDQSLKIFSLTGKLIKKIGAPGDGAGQFFYPNGFALSRDGKIYVADANNSRVQVFAPNGEFRDFLKPPPSDKFALPRGIAIDKLGRIHVVDTLKNKVYVFSPTHKFLFTYGQEKNDSLAYPNGIFIDRDTGLIFVTDRLNERITVWAEK